MTTGSSDKAPVVAPVALYAESVDSVDDPADEDGAVLAGRAVLRVDGR